MENMEKISRFIICGCLWILFLLLLQSCRTHDFFHQVAKNRKYANKVYKKYLKTYGNASMIAPEGTSSVLWYYDKNKIHITDINRAKIASKKEYNCNSDSVINIRKFNPNRSLEKVSSKM